MDNQTKTNNTLKVATLLTRRGWRVIPIPANEKGPRIKDWQKLRLDETDLPSYFNGKSNIGILCGEPSNWLIDVDLDTPEAVAVATYILPETGFRHGRASRPDSHWWYHVPDLASMKFIDPDCADRGEATLVEIRSTGHQTVAPSSTHPSGETYTASAEGEPAHVSAEELVSCVQRVAAAALLARRWSEGLRHEASLALAGTLLRNDWTEEETKSFVGVVAYAAKDEEWESRCHNVMDTARRVDSDQPVKGIPTLITLFGEKVVSKFMEWLEIKRGTAVKPSAPRQGLGAIRTNDRQLRDVVDDTLDAIVKANDPPEVYVRSGQLVRVKVDEHNCGAIEAFTKVSLRSRANECADFETVTIKQVKGQDVVLRRSVHPPLEVMEDILTRYQFNALPPLTGIVSSPVVSWDGTLDVTPGYLPSSRLFFLPPEGELSLALPPPTPKAVKGALCFLFGELLDGFPFADEASKAHTLAAILEPFVRPYISAPTPMKLIDAPTAATGKTMLAETIAAIFCPIGVMPTTAPRDEAEWSKKITAALLTGPSFVLLDNIEGKLSSESLCTVLTSVTWSDRLLGTNTQAQLPVNCQWLATSNNAVLHNDLVTRSVLIRLDAGLENPAERRNFKVPHPPTFVRDNRGRVLDAVLLLIRSWLAAGRPEYSGGAMSRFGRWTRVMGGILECLGVEGFLGNMDQLSRGANPDQATWRAFVEAWAVEFGKPVQLNHLMRLAFGEMNGEGERNLPDGILTEALSAPDEHRRQTKLGIALGKRRDQVISGFRIRKQDGRHAEYHLEPVTENCTPAPLADLDPVISTGEESPSVNSTTESDGLDQGVRPLHPCTPDEDHDAPATAPGERDPDDFDPTGWMPKSWVALDDPDDDFAPTWGDAPGLFGEDRTCVQA